MEILWKRRTTKKVKPISLFAKIIGTAIFIMALDDAFPLKYSIITEKTYQMIQIRFPWSETAADAAMLWYVFGKLIRKYFWTTKNKPKKRTAPKPDDNAECAENFEPHAVSFKADSSDRLRSLWQKIKILKIKLSIEFRIKSIALRVFLRKCKRRILSLIALLKKCLKKVAAFFKFCILAVLTFCFLIHQLILLLIKALKKCFDTAKNLFK